MPILLNPASPTPGSLYSLADVVSHLMELSWLSRSISGQPLEGLVDGVNTIFKVPYSPVSDTPPPAFYTLVSGGKSSLTVTSMNYDTGEVVFSAAPSLTPYVDCDIAMLTQGKLTAIARRGFAEMQVRWRRDIYLYTDGASSPVVSMYADAPVDPVTGASTFSQSDVQKAFFNKSAEYVLCKMMAEDATVNAMAYREERMGGLLVDTSRKAKDWGEYLKALTEDLKRVEDAARTECGEYEDFGEFMPGPQLVEGRWTDEL